MPDAIGVSTLYLLPGMSARIVVPRYIAGSGIRRKIDSSGSLVEINLDGTNGFAVDDTDVGSIEVVDDPSGLAVLYTHKKFGKNKITFYAATGEIGEVHVVAVPVHDHSSIVAGGPAYGTYFTDDEVI